jgi:hypothetical protein
MSMHLVRFSLALLLFASPVFAVPSVVRFVTSEELKTAEGFVMRPNLLERIKASKITRVNENEVHVFFDAPVAGQSSSQVFLSAWAFTTNDNVVFADVRLAEGFYYQPEKCPSEITSPSDTAGGHLFSLLEIRGARREILREQLALNLNSSDINEINNLELLFGLSNEENIDPSMNVFALLDRLSRLEAALGRLK